MSDIFVTPVGKPNDITIVQRHDLLLPAVGNWSALLFMSGNDILPDGAVELQYGGSTLRGWTVRAGEDRGQYTGIMVGGLAGGLEKAVTAQHFYQTPARTVLVSTLSAVGESLASDSEGITGTNATIDYPRRAVACSKVLDDVADMLGLIWRVKLDGSVWFGQPTWPASEVKFTYMSKQPDMLAPLLMPEPNQVLIEPGQTITLSTSASATDFDKTAQRVTCSFYWGDQKGSQCRVWLGDPNSDLLTDDKLTTDRVHAGIAAIARAANRRVDWFRQFQGEVVTQRSNGTCDITLDRIFGEPEMPPIRGAVPSVPVGGSAIRVRAGDRVTVYFENGDPRRPRCGLYETGSGSLGVARQTDTVDRNTAMKTWMSNVETALTALKNPIAVFVGSTIGTISSSSGDLKLRS